MSLKSLLPRPLKAKLRDLHRAWTLQSCLKNIEYRLRNGLPVEEACASRIIYGWSNEGWSAKPALISYLLNEYRDFEGTMVECGSGLSTLLLQMIALRTGAQILSLEHNLEWHELMNRRLAARNLATTSLIYAPLREYGDYDWYDDRAVLSECKSIDVVLCDGPPNSTRGGRYGAMPRMAHLLNDNAAIIVDDAQRSEEAQMIRRWSADSQKQIVLEKTFPNFVVLRVRG